MNTAEEYFMAVVREKSIARAAEKLYLSQQNLSNSIKRLEQRYGVLF
ncbi:MAG: LysR family transcriptional regulator [Clostridium sp.]